MSCSGSSSAYPDKLFCCCIHQPRGLLDWNVSAMLSNNFAKHDYLVPLSLSLSLYLSLSSLSLSLLSLSLSLGFSYLLLLWLERIRIMIAGQRENSFARVMYYGSVSVLFFCVLNLCVPSESFASSWKSWTPHSLNCTFHHGQDHR